MLRAALVVLALLVLPALPARADGAPAPESLRCRGDLAAAPRPPVLLIHGTGVDAEVNWSWGYEKTLAERGHGVCTFDFPFAATVDLQESLPMTAAAVREVSRRAGGRPIATIGHSQGASQAVFALRFWPRLAPLLDDVIGLAGAYDRGSDAIAERCAERCPPPFWQISPRSRFLRSAGTRATPAGPSLTAIGTLHDTVVTPQPDANAVPGGRAIQVQDVCPGRRFVDGLDHIYLAADAVAHALALDALDNPGPADPARIPPLTCALQVYPGADVVKLATLAPKLAAAFGGEGQGTPVDREPVLRCPFAPGCDVLLGVTARDRRLRRGERLALRVRVAREGRLRLRAGGRSAAGRAVAPRTRTLRLALPRLRRGVHLVAVQAQSVAGTGWSAVAAIRVRVL